MLLLCLLLIMFLYEIGLPIRDFVIIFKNSILTKFAKFFIDLKNNLIWIWVNIYHFFEMIKKFVVFLGTKIFIFIIFVGTKNYHFMCMLVVWGLKKLMVFNWRISGKNDEKKKQ